MDRKGDKPIITVDLRKGSAFDGPDPIILHGHPVGEYAVRKEPVTFRMLEDLYARYKTSVPDGLRPRNQYFHAYEYEQMTQEQLNNGANRQKAREALEMAILEGVMNGSLRWENRAAWFWQSRSDPDFVILREWVDVPWKGACQCRHQP